MSSPTEARLDQGAPTRPRGMATRFRLHEGRGTDPAPESLIDDSMIRRPRVHIAPGRLIPGTRYRAVRWLGEGGMGVVYEAEHIDIGRRVAVKILRHHYSDDQDAMELFRQEARATAQVGSDNILQVHDFAQLPDGRLMMAMELLEGHDLMAEMGLPIDPARVIAIARQCCKALASAHDAGLVHRDIKPENIFLVDSGERLGKVKIVDFGIAVVLSGDKTKRKLVGTPQYIAPEAISSNEIAPALDLYALGVVIYEMLTGTIAFEAETVAAMIQAQLHEMPYPPSQVQHSVPPVLDEVVMRCLAKNPTERFADMRDLEAALCEAQIKAGLVTPWDDLPLPDVEPERRAWLVENMPSPRAPVAAGKRSKLPLVLSLIGALLAGGGIAGGIAWSQAQAQTEEPQETEAQRLANLAREAASRGRWVYPPPDDPEADTAYRILGQLEAMEDEPGAAEAAQKLRAELAGNLKQIADNLWSEGDSPEAEGKRIVAREYYEQAQTFDDSLQISDDRRANEREVAALKKRAEYASFSEEELENKEALSVVTASEPKARSKMLAKARDKNAEKTRELERALLALGKAPSNPTKVATAEETTPEELTGTLKDPWEGDASAGEAEDPSAASGSAGAGGSNGKGGGPEPTVRERRDPKQARALAKRGMKALNGRKFQQAMLLFEQALAKNPNDKTALQGMRDACFDTADYGRAARYGKQVVRLAPKSGKHRIALGDAYFKVGRNLQAEKEYEKAQQLGDSRAGQRLALVRRRLGK